MQKFQVFMQDRVMSPLLHQQSELKMPWFLKLFIYFPVLRRIPARMIGIGFGPEHIDITF
jgi:hypothetical protein